MQGNVDSREIWLNYFNNILFEKGVINQKERDKMSQLIRKQCHTPTHADRKIKTFKELR